MKGEVLLLVIVDVLFSNEAEDETSDSTVAIDEVFWLAPSP